MATNQQEDKERAIVARLNPRRVGLAVLVAVGLYASLYAVVESVVRAHAFRNPFFKVSTTQVEAPKLLILGSSRALPLVYDDMNSVVEQQLGLPVVNLAMQGSGIVPNRLLIDYFLRSHGSASVSGVVYMLDSFAFNSPEWNEDRLIDSGVWTKAPLDPQLVTSLLRSVREMDVPGSVFWNYVTGFLKLNDPAGWREPDVWPDERKFDEEYFLNPLQEQARIAYLYPADADESVVPLYEEQFIELARELDEHGVPVIVVSPPLRAAFLEVVPGEAEYKVRVQALLDDLGIPFFDFSNGGYGDELFLDPDHLNREGALRFLEEDLAPLVLQAGW